MSIEAMKQALELAKKLDRDLSVETWELAKVMGQLEQAIAEAETEQGEPATLEEIRKAMIFGISLYNTPQQRKPLTDEQKKSIARRAFKDICKDYPVQDRIILVINDIEAAHGIKE